MSIYKNWRLPQYFQKVVVIFTCVLIFLWIAVTLRFQRLGPSTELFWKTTGAPPKYAFATILTAEGDVEFPDVEEPYLRAVRLLTYQLLHNPRTRNASYEIPLLVLVTPDVPETHQVILRNDGAIVLPVETLERDWIHPKWGRWSNVLAKLNLWTLEEYDKIAFLDADSVIFNPIHEIFEDPATDIRQTIIPASNGTVNSEIADQLPYEYMIAGIHDPWMEQFMPPPEDMVFYKKGSYMNAGFFVLYPSKPVFDYYGALLDLPDQFDSAYPEQNLLNCAHRTDGPMPWQYVGPGWNLKGARESDLKNGLKSLHHKWWRPIQDEYVSDRIAEAVQELEAHLQLKSEIPS
jgi:alpha-N-acetylglucosamine transferase